MKNAKNKSSFLILLQSFSQKEGKNFRKYLNNNYAYSKVMLKIFKYYFKNFTQQQTFPPHDVAYKKIFKSIPQREREIDKLRNGLSDLYLIAKNYLLHKKIEEKGFQRDWQWLQILEDRSLYHQRDLQLKYLKASFSVSGVKNVWTNLYQLQINHFEFFKNDFRKNDPSIDLLPEGVAFLDDFYMSMYLKYATEELNRANLLSVPTNTLPLLQAILEVIENKVKRLSIACWMYYHAYIFVKEKNKTRFEKFRSFLKDNQKVLAREERLFALICLLNYLSDELKKNNLKLLRPTLETYQWGLSEDNILVYDGLIDNLQFRNIVMVACRLKEFEWVEEFVSKHEMYLKKDNRYSQVSLANLMINFGKNNFQRVIEIYNELSFNDLFFELQARIHALSSHYELENYDLLETGCESFLRFLKRNKILGEGNKKAGENFCKILLKISRKKSFKKVVQQDIDNAKVLFFKSWILEKMNSYKRI